MLYVYYGTDEEKSRERLHVALDALMKRAPMAHVTKIEEDDLEQLRMDDILTIQGLFFSKRIVIFDKALAGKERRAVVTARLKEMASSEHVFLILEEAMDAELEKQLTKAATKIQLSGDAKKEKKEDKPDWSITNALERADGRAMWVSLQRALSKDAAPEAIHGQLFWKAKQMTLTRGTDKRVRTLVAALAELPHAARRKGMELEYALEYFALKI